MDPITTAIVTAMGTSLSTQAIKDGYEALKGALKKKFGGESDVVEAVEKLEQKPDSKARQDTVAEEVENAKAKDDSELIKLAQELLKQLDPEGSAAGKYNINVAGDIKGIVGDISGGNINQTIS